MEVRRWDRESIFHCKFCVALKKVDMKFKINKMVWQLLEESGQIKTVNICICNLTPSNQFVRIYPYKIYKEIIELVCKDVCSMMFTVALFIIMPINWKPSVGDWLKKSWRTHTLEYYSAVKKDKEDSHKLTWDDNEAALLNEKWLEDSK